MPTTVIIPSAGLGRRMKSFGPKALIRLGTETVLARQVRLVRQTVPNADIVVVGGFQAERLRKGLPAGVRLVVNDDYEQTNVAHSILLGLLTTDPSSPALLVFGDLVFGLEALGSLDGPSWVLIENSPEREHEVGVNIVDGQAVHFEFGLPNRWGQVALLAPRERILFQRAAVFPNRRRHFAYEILNRVIDAGGVFEANYPADLRLAEIDCSSDIERARELALAAS